MSEPDPPTSDHQRCNRHDGRGWRCKRLVMDGKTLCEIHYVQGRLCSSKRKVPESLKLQRPKSNSKSKRKVPDSPPPVTLDEDADNGGIRANLNRRRTRKRSRPSDEADADDLAEKKTKNKAEELLRVFVKREIGRKKKRRKADGFFSLARRDFSAPTASKKGLLRHKKLKCAAQFVLESANVRPVCLHV